MRIIIEIESDDDLRRIREAFGEERLDIRPSNDLRPSGDGAPAAPAFDPEKRYQELKERFSEFRITLPPDYKFDRNEIHDRHG